MSADELRQAAALMRQRAHDAMYDQASAGVTEWEAFRQDCANSIEPFAEHIASWHPTVALAVADWLERMAGAQDGLEEAREIRKLVGGPPVLLHHPTWDQALAVARTYLGGPS